MRTIYKYPIKLSDLFAIKMPRGAVVLDVQVQDRAPVLWALVDTEAPPQERLFAMLGTGHRADRVDASRHVGSFQMEGGALVFHLFEVG